ncbi:MAG: NGG1p interacting factor NIF3 [Deltaproteobacteria bacterium]|nr:NGG1p interacting factor NIF3 [Deltaproteobacteria bacterium]
MHVLVVYVPATHLETVKEAVFAAGAGHYENYDSCCWQVLGQGQFRPLEGSDPHIGAHGRIETVDEYRVELVCRDNVLPDVLRALIAAHPYEEPAYAAWPILTIRDFPVAD